MGLNRIEKDQLKFEVITHNTRLKFTRLIRYLCHQNDDVIKLIRQNRFINIANNVLGNPIYRLEPDIKGEYYAEELGWHYGEIELIMRRPNTFQFVEILGDFIQEEMLSVEDINNILFTDSVSFYFEESDNRAIVLKIISVDELDTLEDTEEHPNIRKLVKRMTTAHSDKDYSAVLHASASIFETLAKDIVGTSDVQNLSLGWFFDKYRESAHSPVPILDYIQDIFRRRNKEPLAGHGSTELPTITESESVILIEMTKSFVMIERNLANIKE